MLVLKVAQKSMWIVIQTWIVKDIAMTKQIRGERLRERERERESQRILPFSKTKVMNWCQMLPPSVFYTFLDMWSVELNGGAVLGVALLSSSGSWPLLCSSEAWSAIWDQKCKKHVMRISAVNQALPFFLKALASGLDSNCGVAWFRHFAMS